MPNFTATSQVNVPVSAVRADYDSTIAAACVHLTLSNVLCYLSGPCSGTMSCLASSDPACITQCPMGPHLGHSFQLCKGEFLVGATFLDQPEDSSLQKNRDGRNGFEFLEETMERQAVVWVLCHRCYRRGLDVFCACCPFPRPRAQPAGEAPLCHLTWQTQNAFAAACEAGISFQAIITLVCWNEGN